MRALTGLINLPLIELWRTNTIAQQSQGKVRGVTDEDGTVWHLQVTEENIGEVLVLVVAGRISNATAGDLGRALARPDNSHLRGIIVDLSAVDYVNSAGLQQLETAVAQMQGSRCELVVCGLRPVVNAVFQLAGSIPHLTIESSREAAIARLGGQHVPTRNKEMKPFAL